MMPNEIKCLYHITHVDNIKRILSKGILSHAKQLDSSGRMKRGITIVYDKDIIHRRQSIKPNKRNSLWEYANLYINVRNAMLYTVHRNRGNIVVLEISRDILKAKGTYISIGNAASPESNIMPVASGIQEIYKPAIWDKIHAKYWTDNDGKRLVMSEVLVPGEIPSHYITAIHVPDKKLMQKLTEDMKIDRAIAINNLMFFRPIRGFTLSKTKISLVEGDMFLSQHQTLTISVNTMGIMGKGLAARAKYQFSDAYVRYQDACKSKEIGIGKPFVYNRVSKDKEWEDRDYRPRPVRDNTKFLFFATKQDWRRDSKIEYITEGLNWLLENYKHEGITSIALPALGCGLGKLKWKDVGPLMCQTLHKMNIPASIYLPNEHDIDESQKTREFLLKERIMKL